MRPRHLAPNLIDHYYAGGPKIAELRGIETTSPRQPEEWVAATVERAGETGVGLARTVEGDVLRDLIETDPRAWLGTQAEGTDTGLLVKLLDAGQRLPVHVHPDRVFASRHLDCPYGKTESWFVLDSTDDGAVYLGWDQDVDPDEVARRRDEQDTDWMLAHLNRVEVSPGDGILVPAGTAHAIGEGVFVVEVQEPTDFSILLEWSITTSTRDESHLDLGFDLAMTAVSYAAMSAETIEALTVRTRPDGRFDATRPVLPAAADPFFRLDLLAPQTGASADVAAGFAALVVIDGQGEIAADAGAYHVARGDVLAVPAAFGDWQARGPVTVLAARPGVGGHGTR